MLAKDIYNKFKVTYNSNIDYSLNEDFKNDLILLKNSNKNSYGIVFKKLSATFNSIMDRISNIDKRQNITTGEIFHLYINEINEIPLCKNCQTNINSFNPSNGYSVYCSSKCCNSDIIKQTKSNDTKEERYGDRNYNNSKKAFNTNILKYGFKTNFNNSELMIKSLQNKYNVINPGQITEVKDKIRKTKLDRYNSETYNNMEKNMKTKEERYGDRNYNNYEKCKVTCLDKYGYESASNSKTIKDKISKSLANHYNLRRVEDNISGIVYVIYFPEIELVKIGVTNNLSNRLKEFKSLGKIKKIKIIYSQNCYKLENYFHKKFDKYRTILHENIGGRTEFFSKEILKYFTEEDIILL